jgi:cytochrome c oxidase subunit 2
MVSQAKRLGQPLLGTLCGLAAALSSGLALAEPGRWQTNMPQGVTAVGQDIYGLHMLIFGICVVIGIGVFAWMFYSIYAYRKSRGAKAESFHENTTVEVLWTVVPFIILIGMAFPATKTMIDIYDTEDADLDVLVTGYQWKWSYEYLTEDGENVKFFSNLASTQDQIYGRTEKSENYLLEVDNPLVLPVGKKVRLLITANDVIHSWWVPDLAVKKDAIPGFINEAQAKPLKEGVYRGQCAELCGKDHGFMPVVVNVTSEAEFDSWLAAKQAEAAELQELMAQQFTLPELVERGAQVYQRACLACHGDKGQGGVGNALAGSAYAVGPIADELDIIVYGSKTNAVMQAFGGQLNDLDLAAVATYVRNSFGNNMGDSIQAVDVYNFKKQGQ